MQHKQHFRQAQATASLSNITALVKLVAKFLQKNQFDILKDLWARTGWEMQNSPYSSICTAPCRLQFPPYLNKIVWSIRVFSSLCCPHTSWSAQELTEQVVTAVQHMSLYRDLTTSSSVPINSYQIGTLFNSHPVYKLSLLSESIYFFQDKQRILLWDFCYATIHLDFPVWGQRGKHNMPCHRLQDRFSNSKRNYCMDKKCWATGNEAHVLPKSTFRMNQSCQWKPFRRQSKSMEGLITTTEDKNHLDQLLENVIEHLQIWIVRKRNRLNSLLDHSLLCW